MSGKILSINISINKGEKKRPIQRATLIEGYGIEGDAHAGEPLRQVSILSKNDIDRMKGSGLQVDFGDFAENITVDGIDPSDVKIGDRFAIKEAVLEITQIGKRCHKRCKIFEVAGYCIMPESGIFMRVVKGGEIAVGDPLVKI